MYFKFALLIFYLYLYNSRVYQPSWHISFILIGHTIHLENHSIHDTDPRNPHFCHSRIHNTSSAFPYLLSDSLAHCLHCSIFEQGQNPALLPLRKASYMENLDILHSGPAFFLHSRISPDTPPKWLFHRNTTSTMHLLLTFAGITPDSASRFKHLVPPLFIFCVCFHCIPLSCLLLPLFHPVLLTDFRQTAPFTVGFRPCRTNVSSMENQTVTKVTALLRRNDLPKFHLNLFRIFYAINKTDPVHQANTVRIRHDRRFSGTHLP